MKMINIMLEKVKEFNLFHGNYFKTILYLSYLCYCFSMHHLNSIIAFTNFVIVLFLISFALWLI